MTIKVNNYVEVDYFTGNNNHLSFYFYQNSLDIKNVYMDPFKSEHVWNCENGNNFICVKEHKPIFYFKK